MKKGNAPQKADFLPLSSLGLTNGIIGIVGIAQPSPVAKAIGAFNLAVGVFGITKAVYDHCFSAPSPGR